MKNPILRVRNRIRETSSLLKSVKPMADRILVAHGSDAVKKAKENARVALGERRIVEWIYWKCIVVEIEDRTRS